MASKKSQKKKKIGFCKLTHEKGILIKSHLIPQAFTRPSIKGNPLIQYGNNTPQIRRWSSWYDPDLVIQKGEDILTKLDTWAIKELRKNKLVWSGWGNDKALGNLQSINSHFTSWYS